MVMYHILPWLHPQIWIVFSRRQEAWQDLSTKALYFSLFARNRYGVMTEVNQTLKLEDTPKINNRNFDGGIAAILSNTNTGTKYKYRLNTGTIFFKQWIN